jgi:hypothetical protein
MRKWMYVLILLVPPAAFLLVSWVVDSPHGKDFRISCSVCHSSKGWQLDKAIYTYDHNTAKFALKGVHTMVSCRTCHPSLVFTDAGTECRDCHTDVHEATVGQDCGRCHTQDSWLVNDGAGLHRNTRFPLLGAHASAVCTDCHTSETFLQFRVLGIECFDCHKNDYLATTDPNHAASGFSTLCSSCHRLNALTWGGGGFDHSFFPLRDGHDINICSQCHQGGVFTGLSPSCYSCHSSNYQGTANPNHTAAGFSNACNECHSLVPGWKPAQYNHNMFPLTLGHDALLCTACHQQGIYVGLSTDCYACHQENFNSSINPPHLASGFPQQCTQCHTTNPGWKPATFDHTIFPLTLGHATPGCADCHKNGNYTSTSAECVSCHQDNYNASSNPPHLSGGFPVQCTQCHTTNPGWKPATFNHTMFPLTLGHATPTCADCHKNGNYTNISTDCISCHQEDFNTTALPGHGISHIGNACTECHTTNPGWKPVRYPQHDARHFPIYTGKHAGKWDACTDCHTNASNYALNSCTVCHEHNKLDMDDKHNGVSNYVYSSPACLQCHPRGNSDKK